MAAPVYTDFNLLRKNDNDLKDLVSLAIKLGYERIAINNVVTDLKGGKKQKDKVPIALPRDILLSKEIVNTLKAGGKKLEQFSRLTAVLEDAANTHRLSSPEIQEYDILAVQPTDEKTFQLACSTLEVDIITFNMTEPIGYFLKRPLLKLAAERGIHFEISYSKALQDSSIKRQILSNAMVLVEFSKGKNIILSSGSELSIEVRSPFDVMNLSTIFGLSHVQAKNAIMRNNRAVILHAASRKSCKSVISATMISNLPSADKWVIEAHSKLTNKVSDDESDSDEEESDANGDGDEHDEGQPVKKKIKV